MHRLFAFLVPGLLALCLAACPNLPNPDPDPDPDPDPNGENEPDLGPNASLNGAQVFPEDNPWNMRVDSLPVDPNSDAIIDSIGRTDNLHPDFGANFDGGPFGIPYIVVAGNTPGVAVTFDFADESDAGPYPITDDTPIEGGPDSEGDRHMIMIDRESWTLYELFYAFPPAGAGQPWTAGSGAIWDLASNDLRPEGWTSADAAGLPIFPGLVRYDEVVEQGEVNHAFRFTVRRSRRAYVPPARHFASRDTGPDLPPMGMRVRLKADFDTSGFSPHNQVILRAMKEYGMIVADNGSDWYVSGAPDARWDDDELGELKTLQGDNFEVVRMEGVVVGD